MLSNKESAQSAFFNQVPPPHSHGPRPRVSLADLKQEREPQANHLQQVKERIKPLFGQLEALRASPWLVEQVTRYTQALDDCAQSLGTLHAQLGAPNRYTIFFAHTEQLLTDIEHFVQTHRPVSPSNHSVDSPLFSLKG